MIEIGKKQKLIVAKTVDFGVYLAENKKCGTGRASASSRETDSGRNERRRYTGSIYL